MQITPLALKAFITSTVLTLFAVNVEVGRTANSEWEDRGGQKAKGKNNGAARS